MGHFASPESECGHTINLCEWILNVSFNPNNNGNNHDIDLGHKGLFRL